MKRFCGSGRVSVSWLMRVLSLSTAASLLILFESAAPKDLQAQQYRSYSSSGTYSNSSSSGSYSSPSSPYVGGGYYSAEDNTYYGGEEDTSGDSTESTNTYTYYESSGGSSYGDDGSSSSASWLYQECDYGEARQRIQDWIDFLENSLDNYEKIYEECSADEARLREDAEAAKARLEELQSGEGWYPTDSGSAQLLVDWCEGRIAELAAKIAACTSGSSSSARRRRGGSSSSVSAACSPEELERMRQELANLREALGNYKEMASLYETLEKYETAKGCAENAAKAIAGLESDIAKYEQQLWSLPC